ncbi:WD40 repeat-like protein [Imleria badia]|nr:WD40 repeat-like protein [Imleria badia]
MSGSPTETNPTIVVDSGSLGIYTVAFHPDGMHFVGGTSDGIRRWRLADGQEVGKQTGMDLNAIAVSGDGRWIVCGTELGASVWDAELQEKAIDVEGPNSVHTVDVSPDSTRFATGTRSRASIWSITTGERLVGPLRHDNTVTGIKFSPNGDHVATACRRGPIHVFDSHSGDQLITIKTIIPSSPPITPLAWSNNGERIFATSDDKKIKCFDVSTGSQLAESPTLSGGIIESIAVAASGRFVATYAYRSISFLDASTLSRIGPAIEDSEDIRSIALSPDSSNLAAGQYKGRITVRNLSNVLPDSYGPFQTYVRQSESVETRQVAVPSHLNGDASHTGQGADPKKVDDLPAWRIRLTRSSNKVTILIGLPSWMCCHWNPDTEHETH